MANFSIANLTCQLHRNQSQKIRYSFARTKNSAQKRPGCSAQPLIISETFIAPRHLRASL